MQHDTPNLSFLEPEQIRENREWGGLAPEYDAPLIAGAKRILANPALCARMETAYRRNYVEDAPCEIDDGIESLLLATACVPLARAAHQALGIPEAVTRATCTDVRICADRYHIVTGGEIGMEQRLLSWLGLHASGELVRLGRLQFILRRFRGPMDVFRHVQTGGVITLVHEGVQFDREGMIDGNGDAWDTECGWTSHLVRTEQTVIGSPVSPFGMALHQEVTLLLDEWKLVMRQGDPVLEMHIPRGEPLTMPLYIDSMRQAVAFFAAIYPDKSYRAFACNSWMFNTQLETMLPPTSNLVAFLREGYLFPVQSYGNDGISYVFYRDEVDVATAPRDTTLRRAMLDHLAAGKRLRRGGMFLLREDLDSLGSQLYRRQWPDVSNQILTGEARV